MSETVLFPTEFYLEEPMTSQIAKVLADDIAKLSALLHSIDDEAGVMADELEDARDVVLRYTSAAGEAIGCWLCDEPCSVGPLEEKGSQRWVENHAALAPLLRVDASSIPDALAGQRRVATWVDNALACIAAKVTPVAQTLRARA